MAEMTATGCRMLLANGEYDVISVGDEVELANGYTGYVSRWTKDDNGRLGVGVRVENGPVVRMLTVLMFDCTDQDIVRVVKRYCARMDGKEMLAEPEREHDDDCLCDACNQSRDVW